MLDIEVIGAQAVPAAPPSAEVQRLVALALASAAVEDGHIAVEFVDAGRIAELNAEHRDKSCPSRSTAPASRACRPGCASSGTS